MHIPQRTLCVEDEFNTAEDYFDLVSTVKSTLLLAMYHVKFQATHSLLELHIHPYVLFNHNTRNKYMLVKCAYIYALNNQTLRYTMLIGC